MPRQSTTQRITRHVQWLLLRAHIAWDGVVIRHKGQEYGATAQHEGYTETFEGRVLPYHACTIRKTTVATLERLYGMKERVAA